MSLLFLQKPLPDMRKIRLTLLPAAALYNLQQPGQFLLLFLTKRFQKPLIKQFLQMLLGTPEGVTFSVANKS